MSDLASLLAKSRISDVITELFNATDRRDWPAVHAVLADQVLLDMASVGGGAPGQQTPQQITAAWQGGLKHLIAVHHQIGNLRISVQGDEAQAFCYGTASHYLPNPSGQNTRTFVGSYDLALIRQDGDWRISAFRFNLKYLDGNPALEKSAGL
ncbi:SnoaL-like domain-containing protein [Andreprevotia lacus DSM 23236]|jgi:ketosteroid isomerase-like protein|uniref:SnoaL-like domain-containing protein n=1 Tax=Andreprevotia lacus DSM 23236 TaxID=1121001 RepID=A0A1W1X9U2_9NEIS|nr:nuclear transport factor 2 family protein [Andreprevotia lacus]SMC20775.1 SnoaL-like domain-containing protein [Andreprevotia lacus DSM 23236]